MERGLSVRPTGGENTLGIEGERWEIPRIILLNDTLIGSSDVSVDELVKRGCSRGPPGQSPNTLLNVESKGASRRLRYVEAASVGDRY